MSYRFDGKVAIVTGAGHGLGRAHALELARRGAKVVVNDLGSNVDGTGGSSEAARSVVEEIKSMGGEAIANGGSVADPQGAQSMVDDAMNAWGRIDVLINNAGILRDKSFKNLTMEDFRLVTGSPPHRHRAGDQGRLADPERAGIRPHRGHHLRLGPVGQLRPDQLQRGQAGHRRLHEHAGQGRRQEEHPHQCHRAHRRAHA
jgi:hypothetical protein